MCKGLSVRLNRGGSIKQRELSAMTQLRSKGWKRVSLVAYQAHNHNHCFNGCITSWTSPHFSSASFCSVRKRKNLNERCHSESRSSSTKNRAKDMIAFGAHSGQCKNRKWHALCRRQVYLCCCVCTKFSALSTPTPNHLTMGGGGGGGGLI